MSFPIINTDPVSALDDILDVDIFLSEDREEEERNNTISGEGEGADQVEERTLLTIGNNQNNNALEADVLEYVAAVPQYPSSHVGGYAYIVRLPGNPRDDQQEKLIKQMKSFQYSKASKVGKKPTFCPLLNAHASRWIFQCSGVKHCESIQDQLRTITHTTVTPELERVIRTIKSSLSLIEDDERKRKAKSYFGAITRRFRMGCCNPSLQSCGPKLCVSRQIPLTGLPPLLVGCTSWRPGTTEKHFIQRVPNDIDTQYLGNLIRGFTEPRQERCNVVEPMCTRLKHCGKDHIQGPGNLIPQGCSVVFNIIIPNNISEVPYMILVSTGVHQHVPPKPWLISQDYLDEIIGVIQPILQPDMTRTEFLKSDALTAYLQGHGYHSIEELHLAFIDKDKISRILHRERLIKFPYGGGLEGVIFEWKAHHSDPATAYIQKVLPGTSGSIVICLFRDQALLLQKQSTIQIDMSFKRLKGEWSEILFAAFLPDHGRLFTFGRIMTSAQTSQIYERAFIEFFATCTDLTRVPFHWMHLHGDGMVGITVDMDSKQMAGFGKYLQTLDPYHRAWQWQLSCCLRFCSIHFYRGIDRAAPQCPHVEDSDWGRMKSLLTAESQLEYMELCDLIANSTGSESIRNWVEHKKNHVIAAGLNYHCNRMLEAQWNTLESHTNAVEQAASMGYRTGVKHKLLEGVKMALHMDRQDILTYKARDEHDLRHRSRQTLSLRQRYFQNIGREIKRKRQTEPIEISDDDDEVVLERLESFSSSGVQQRRQRPTARKSTRGRSYQSSLLRSSAILSSPLPRQTPLRSSAVPSSPPPLPSQPPSEMELFQQEKERVLLEREKRQLYLDQQEIELQQKERELNLKKRHIQLAREQEQVDLELESILD